MDQVSASAPASPTKPSFFSMQSRIVIHDRWIRFVIGWIIGVMLVDFLFLV